MINKRQAVKLEVEGESHRLTWDSTVPGFVRVWTLQGAREMDIATKELEAFGQSCLELGQEIRTLEIGSDVMERNAGALKKLGGT